MKAIKKLIAFTGKGWEKFKTRGYVAGNKYVIVVDKDYDPRDTVKFKVKRVTK